MHALLMGGQKRELDLTGLELQTISHTAGTENQIWGLYKSSWYS